MHTNIMAHTRNETEKSLKKGQPSEMASKCGQAQTGNQADVPETRQSVRGWASHPVDAAASRGPVCARLGSRPREAQSSGGERRRWRVTERGGADGSAIWWMEEKLGR